MIILVKQGSLNGRHSISFEEFFEEYQILTMHDINNWDNVVDNIKDLKIRNKVVSEGVLFGNEYPPDTPITEGGER